MSREDALKDYVEVNVRIEKFYEKYPDGSIQTEITHLDNDKVIIKAYAYRDREDTKPATGHAMEKEGSSFINKTSHIENCETSAVGRALAILGFEVKKSVASKEEVENAKLNQDGPSKATIKGKYESIGAKMDDFEAWYSEQISKYNLNQIDAFLTKKLKEKRGA